MTGQTRRRYCGGMPYSTQGCVTSRRKTLWLLTKRGRGPLASWREYNFKLDRNSARCAAFQDHESPRYIILQCLTSQERGTSVPFGRASSVLRRLEAVLSWRRRPTCWPGAPGSARSAAVLLPVPCSDAAESHRCHEAQSLRPLPPPSPRHRASAGLDVTIPVLSRASQESGKQNAGAVTLGLCPPGTADARCPLRPTESESAQECSIKT